MQTSDSSIWACGDCAEAKHIITGKPVYIPLGTTVNKQGRVAGDNLAGGKEAFGGVLESAVTKIFQLFAASTGLTKEQAAENGYQAETAKASYYPGIGENRICLAFDTISGKV